MLLLKRFSQGIIILTLLFFFSNVAYAHVIVSPHQVGVAATQDFSVSVPNERDNPVVAISLLIPKGVSAVIPNAIQGWTITTKSKGSGDSTTVTEIDWVNGSIPVGQREEFIFQAQVPPQPTTINWKAYQTYSDGTVVSWDVDPVKISNLSDAQQDAMAGKENKGEYSTTQVINDLTSPSPSTPVSHTSSSFPMSLSVLSIILSGLAITIAMKKNNS